MPVCVRAPSRASSCADHNYVGAPRQCRGAESAYTGHEARFSAYPEAYGRPFGPPVGPPACRKQSKPAVRWRVPALHGPHPLSGQGQVKLPVKLQRALHLEAGDEFYWRHSDDDPDVLVLIPAEVVERRYAAGDRQEAATRPTAATLPHATVTPRLP